MNTKKVTADVQAGDFSRPAAVPLLSRALGVAIALGGTQAWAQQANAPASPDNSPDAAPSTEKATQLEKISVHDADEMEPTSPKFTAPLLDTPLSVTVLPQSVMQEAAATSLQDALRNVPGITFAAGEGGTPTGDLPSIRGFNSAGSIYVDGMRDIGLQDRDVFALQQVEVVKGPDSSIAGRSAGGGAINMVSKTAEAGQFAAVTGTYGTAGQFRATFDGNLQLAEGIAARLDLMHMGGGVPGRDSAVRTDKWGIAPTVTFGLQSPTRLVLDYYHFEDRSTPDYGVPVDYFSTGKPLTETQGIDPKNFYGLKDRDFRRNPVNSGTARVEHDFAAFTLRSQLRYTASHNDYVLTLPYQAVDADYNPEPGLVYRLPITNNDRTRGLISQTDLSGHFDTGGLRHDVDLGFEASQEKERLLGGGSYLGYNVVSPAGPQGFNGGDCSDPALLASYDCTSLANPDPHDPWQGTVTLNTAEIANFTTRVYAPYAFDTITLTPHWKLNAGLRWDRYRTEASDPVNPTNWGGSDHDSLFSYQLGIMFKPTGEGTLYLATSSAAIPESQAASGAGQDEPYPTQPGSWAGTIGLKPERTRSLELGSKWNLLGNHLLLSGDVFEERHRNTAVYVSDDAVEQFGKSRVRGAEISANGSISENWNVIAGYSYLHARITRGADDDNPREQLPNTPPSTFSLWSTYRAMPQLVVGGGAYYRDRQIGYGGYGGTPESIDSYWRLDAMARWQAVPDLAVQLNVQNLANKLYYAKSFYWYATPAAGRTWLLTAEYRFNGRR
ncbi:MAG TPA: TonB-dependent siderophore receptor [Steroidobacteraceae bacterium]|nr:TonB-dependent siderophore receptor [Steroidobacteraceae bacterium]